MRWTQHDVDEFLARQRTPQRRGLQDTGSKPIASPAPSPKARTRKYLNQPTTSSDGITHDAKGECERWEELRLLERAGSIRSLRRQVPYALVVSGVLVCTYIADFVYEEGAATIVEDRKSPRTRQLAAFRIKRKLMLACHGIEVREV